MADKHVVKVGHVSQKEQKKSILSSRPVQVCTRMREGMKRQIADLRTAARKNSIYAFVAIKKNNKSLSTQLPAGSIWPQQTHISSTGGGGPGKSMVGKCLHVLSRSQREPPEFTEKGI